VYWAKKGKMYNIRVDKDNYEHFVTKGFISVGEDPFLLTKCI